MNQAALTLRTRGASDTSPASMASRARTIARRLRSSIHRPRLLRGPRTETPLDAPVLRTSRLILRPHRLSDADSWYTLQSASHVIEFLPWGLRDRERSRQHLRERTRHTRLWQVNDFLALGVELDGALIGDVSLHLRSVDSEVRTAEMGWIVDPVHEGKGYAAEAAGALLDFAFDHGIQRVTAVIDPRNLRSRALASRLGFVRMVSDTNTRMIVTAEQRGQGAPGDWPLRSIAM